MVSVDENWLDGPDDSTPCGRCGVRFDQHPEDCAVCECNSWVPPDPPEDNSDGPYDTREEKEMA